MARWVEETIDPVTGERLVFMADTEVELEQQLADRFGTDSTLDVAAVPPGEQERDSTKAR